MTTAPGPAATGSLVDARAEAAARHVAATLGTAPSASVRAIVVGYARDPGLADRLARDAVAEAPDAAILHAAIGALFDGLGDPARARAAWQAAVDASAEPLFLRGLAEAQGRQGDGDAALVQATAAAAWCGDPAVVWAAVAHALNHAGKNVHALDAARSAIDLAGPETLASALDAAITASQALGRIDQVTRLATQKAHLFPATSDGSGPSEASAALEAYRAAANVAALDRLWQASRANAHDVDTRAALRRALPSEDARAATLISELIALASDPDPEIRRAAVAALAP